LSVGVDKDVVSTPFCQRLVADDAINGTDTGYVLLTAHAVLQQTTTSTTDAMTSFIWLKSDENI